MLGEPVNGLLNGLNASGLPHGNGGEVGVTASAVPVSHHGFGVQRDDHPEIFSNSVEKEPRQPEIIAHSNSLGGSHLELPLCGHHLRVGAGDVDAGVETGTVVGLYHVAAVDLVSSHTA